MAHSAIKSEDEKQEYFDSPEEFEQKVNQLAEWIVQSTHAIAFTGAGISTSTGIPDFRSGYNTVLPTGPGCWEVSAQAQPYRRQKLVEITEAIPSSTHMAFCKLIKRDIFKHIISQNVDGLHRKSGIPASKLSELHGNCYVEKCNRCGKEYLRDYETRTNRDVARHETGNKCDDSQCQGDLCDTIINFGESLDRSVITKAYQESRIADLCLAMGSSLRVTPAADMPMETKRQGGKLIIVNLQKTPLDQNADLVIHAFCDNVMERLMQILDRRIDEFRLVRYLQVTVQHDERYLVRFMAIDQEGQQVSIFKDIGVNYFGKKAKLEDEPFQLSLNRIDGTCKVKLYFYGHYKEPELIISMPLYKLPKRRIYTLVYNPFEGIWERIKIDDYND